MPSTYFSQRGQFPPPPGLKYTKHPWRVRYTSTPEYLSLRKRASSQTAIDLHSFLNTQTIQSMSCTRVSDLRLSWLLLRFLHGQERLQAQEGCEICQQSNCKGQQMVKSKSIVLI